MLGTFLAYKPFVIFAVLGVVFAATYMLWMVKRVFFGPAGKIVTEWKGKSLDINTREIAVLVPLVLMIFWMGIFPNHFFKYTEKSIDHLVKNKTQYFLSIKPQLKNNGSYSQMDN